MLNHGMFDGTNGWALKPNGYRSSEVTDTIARRSLELSIEVFAAQDLALPPNHSEKGFKPYIVAQLHVEEPEGPVAADRDDASTDTEKSSYRRRTKTCSGRNPDFEGQKLVFPVVAGVVEELSFVRLVYPFFLRCFLLVEFFSSMHVLLAAFCFCFTTCCSGALGHPFLFSFFFFLSLLVRVFFSRVAKVSMLLLHGSSGCPFRVRMHFCLGTHMQHRSISPACTFWRSYLLLCMS